jgi:hypothetical protein
MFDFAACDAIPGWMNEDELRWLHDEAAQAESVVEIGCWKGRSAMALGQGCRGRVNTYDHFAGSEEHQELYADALSENLYAIARNNLAAFPHVRVTFLESRRAAHLHAPHSVDMVFIDGDHSRHGALTDLMLWYPKVRRLFCGHDRSFTGVEAALVTFGIPWEEGPGDLWFMRIGD